MINNRLTSWAVTYEVLYGRRWQHMGENEVWAMTESGARVEFTRLHGIIMPSATVRIIDVRCTAKETC